MSPTFFISRSFFLLLAGLATIGCQNSAPDSNRQTLVLHRGKVPAMGVEIKYELYLDPGSAPKADQTIAETLRELEETLSDYRRDSEVNRVSKSSPHLKPVVVSEHLWRLCCLGNEISRATDGAFDVTIGPLSHLWRAAIKRNRLPDEEKIAAAKKAVGFERLLVLPDSEIQLTVAEMQLDFGGIAKGYAADVILDRLAELGIDNALIDASGDVAVRGLPPNREHWNLEVAAVNSVAALNLSLKKGAVATSGDAFQSLIVDGVHYSHIVDPRTGWACKRSAQVTVIAPDGATADALASAFSVLEPERAFQIADSMPEVAVRIIYRNDSNSFQLEVIESSRFKEAVKSQN
jgi:thiamine biosynthesis lipoprotein